MSYMKCNSRTSWCSYFFKPQGICLVVGIVVGFIGGCDKDTGTTSAPISAEARLVQERLSAYMGHEIEIHASSNSVSSLREAIVAAVATVGGEVSSVPLSRLAEPLAPTDPPLILINSDGQIIVATFIGMRREHGLLQVWASGERKPRLFIDSSAKELELNDIWSISLPRDNLRDDNIAVGGGRIRFDRIEHNLGSISSDVSSRAEFIVENTGAEVVNIDRITSSCGCTAVTTDGDYLQIMPGDRRHILATLAPTRALGFNHTVLVSFSDHTKKSTKEVRLSIVGNAIHPIQSTPSQITFNVNMTAIAPIERVIRLSENYPEGFSITHVDVGDLPLEITHDPVSNTQIRSHLVRLSLDPRSLQPGQYKGQVEIFSDHPDTNKITVPIEIVIAHRVNVYPSKLSFGRHTIQDGPIRTVRLEAATQRPIRILDVITSKNIRAKYNREEALTHEVEIVVESDKVGFWKEEIKLYVSTDSWEDWVSVELTGLCTE